MKRKTIEDFKCDMYNKFKDEYTVIGTEYINNRTPILVRHSCGNEFKVTPFRILVTYKQGCPFCAKNKQKTHEQFIEEFYKIFDKDEYVVLDRYTNADTPIQIKHLKCGNIRRALPHRLLKGDRCNICYGMKRKTIDEIKNELVLGNLEFDVISTDNEYISNKIPITFRCKKCNNIFKARTNDILSNHKECPHCSKRKISKAELIIKNILEKNNVSFTQQRKFSDLFVKNKKKTYLKFDFAVIINNEEILIEFDGEQHYRVSNKSNVRFTKEDILQRHKLDVLKNTYCINNNIKLMRITFENYNNIETIISNFLSSTTIPDEFKVVEPSGSKDSAALWKKYNPDVDDIV